MAKKKQRVERVTVTLSGGTKVTAPQEVIDKVEKQDKASVAQRSAQRSASK
jgi:hypothetical protein